MTTAAAPEPEPPLSHERPCSVCSHGGHRFFACDTRGCTCGPQVPPGYFD